MENKKQAIENLIKDAAPGRDFYILVAGAAILALSGIFLDSIPVLIASMIVAPLAAPILALALGLAAGDLKIFAKSASTLFFSAFWVAVFSVLGSLFIKRFLNIEIPREIIAFIPNYFFDILIAVLSGAIAAYGLLRPKVGSAMTGIGIAVSLMPPLVGFGMELAGLNVDFALNALIIFILNVGGILAGSAFIFRIFNFKKEYEKI